MPAEIQTGKAVVFGITNNGGAITMTGYATFILDSVKGSHKFELDDVKDENKYDVSLIATNGRLEISVTWKPSGATRAAAATTAVIIAPLTKVTLSNFKVAAYNGDWVYIGDEELTVEQAPASMSLKLRKYDDATQNASLTTTVVG
jgi:hypothetical protein